MLLEDKSSILKVLLKFYQKRTHVCMKYSLFKIVKIEGTHVSFPDKISMKLSNRTEKSSSILFIENEADDLQPYPLFVLCSVFSQSACGCSTYPNKTSLFIDSR